LGKVAGGSMKLTTPSHLVPKLSMNDAAPLLHRYAFIESTQTTSHECHKYVKYPFPSDFRHGHVTEVTDRFNASLDAHYRPLILHMLPALVHHVVANAFKGTINLKLLHPGQ
jgi:hypothetical protein